MAGSCPAVLASEAASARPSADAPVEEPPGKQAQEVDEHVGGGRPRGAHVPTALDALDLD